MLFLQKFNSTLHINLKIVLFTHSDVNICAHRNINLFFFLQWETTLIPH